MDALLQGIERDQAQRHLNRAIDGAGDHIVVEQTPQHLMQRFVQPPSLGQQPFFERLAAVGEALEQCAPIEIRGAFHSFGRAVGGEPQELPDIDLQAARPDGQLVPVHGKAVLRVPWQALAQARERLAQVGPSLARRLVAP